MSAKTVLKFLRKPRPHLPDQTALKTEPFSQSSRIKLSPKKRSQTSSKWANPFLVCQPSKSYKIFLWSYTKYNKFKPTLILQKTSSRRCHRKTLTLRRCSSNLRKISACYRSEVRGTGLSFPRRRANVPEGWTTEARVCQCSRLCWRVARPIRIYWFHLLLA